MIEDINAPISVILTHNHKTKQSMPAKIRWGNKDYKVTKIGFHHKFHKGRVLFHIFSVVAQTLFFRLEYNTETLQWRVTEIADNEVS